MMKIIYWLRSTLMMCVAPWTVVVLGTSVVICHILFKNKKIDDWHISTWGKINYKMFGIDLVVHGQENIPSTGCLFLFNHSSYFDIFALCGALPGIRFGAKAELFKIPIFSQAMRILGTLPIARQSREEVYKIYDEAKIRLRTESFALSPEGGRFYGPHLAPFKAGPFIFAMSAEALIVPVVIIGAYQCLPMGGLIPNKDKASRTIEVHILEPISSIGYLPATRQKLQAQVYSAMDPIWSKNFEIV